MGYGRSKKWGCARRTSKNLSFLTQTQETHWYPLNMLHESSFPNWALDSLHSNFKLSNRPRNRSHSNCALEFTCFELSMIRTEYRSDQISLQCNGALEYTCLDYSMTRIESRSNQFPRQFCARVHMLVSSLQCFESTAEQIPFQCCGWGHMGLDFEIRNHWSGHEHMLRAYIDSAWAQTN